MQPYFGRKENSGYSIAGDCAYYPVLRRDTTRNPVSGYPTISFKTCTVHYKYFDAGLEHDADRAANNELALCLCNSYAKKRDTAVAKQILKIYREYGSHNGPDSISYMHHNNLDSIIKEKKTAFDTLILVD